MFKKKNVEEKQNNDPLYQVARREKRFKIIKACVALVIVFVLVFIIVAVATGDGHQVNFDKEGVEGVREVAEEEGVNLSAWQKFKNFLKGDRAKTTNKDTNDFEK